MKRLAQFLNEMAMVDKTNLDFDFIRQAEKPTRFNIDVKDLIPRLQNTIRYLYVKNFFPKFAKKDNFLKSFNAIKINNAIKLLKQENKTQFSNMYQFDQSGIGPGELMLYFLIDGSSVGGGGSAGVDLIVGNKQYEAKSAEFDKGRNQVKGFKLGGTGELAPILAAAQRLKKKHDAVVNPIGTMKRSNKISEINKQQMDKLKELEPKAWAQIEKNYSSVAKTYFGTTNLVFMHSKRASGGKIGEIFASGIINANKVFIDQITSNTIKPAINIKDIR